MMSTVTLASEPNVRNNRPWILKDLLELLSVSDIRGEVNVPVRGLAVDSRQIGAGFIFVAIVGDNHDGHRFLEDARKQGAVAVVSEQVPRDVGLAWIQIPDARRAAGVLSATLAGEPSRQMDLVGITGTNGKSTTAFLVDHVLERLAPPSALMGTVIQRIGGATRLTRHTTPEAPELQSFLSRAVEEGCRYGTLEVSSHGLAMGRVEGTQFACAVFTNLSRDHLDFHRDMEDYFNAKRRLFEDHLRPGGTAVIGIDDDYGRRLAESLSTRKWTFGFAPDADIRADGLRATFDGLELEIHERGRSRRFVSPLIGRHNALNLLAAYGVGRVLGFEPNVVLEALGEARGAPGRYEKVEEGQPFHVVVDYAHTDDALRNLLQTTRALPHQKILTVFGCGGDRDRSKRPLMGAVAARLSDTVILTSDNPRSEDPEAIIREIELGTKGSRSRAQVLVEPDRRSAIELALSLAEPEDVVLISGKGHETYQAVGGQVVPFDDREVVREILSEEVRDQGKGAKTPRRKA
jgi:UDP-N-acetylmuramoyl-L-alanyl-D-glutamate--2,6-diaminopimelate ligase